MVSCLSTDSEYGPPKRLSIAHWKALGESYLLSHKSSSGGVGVGWYEGVLAAILYFFIKWCILIRRGTVKFGQLM